MNPTTVLAFLPYFVGIALKLSSLIKDKKMMLSALEDLINLPKPPNSSFELTRDQREVLVAHLSHSNLKATTIITSLSSLFAASVLVIRHQAQTWMIATLLAFLLLGLGVISWVLPKKVYYFHQVTRLGLKKGTIITLLMCLYDLLLAALAIASVETQVGVKE